MSRIWQSYTLRRALKLTRLDKAYHQAASRGAKQLREPGEYENTLFIGNAELENSEQVPAAIWTATKGYWDRVGKEVAEELHSAAASGLTASRFPMDLKKGLQISLTHLAGQRQLARILSTEAFRGVRGTESRMTPRGQFWICFP